MMHRAATTDAGRSERSRFSVMCVGAAVICFERDPAGRRLLAANLGRHSERGRVFGGPDPAAVHLFRAIVLTALRDRPSLHYVSVGLAGPAPGVPGLPFVP